MIFFQRARSQELFSHSGNTSIVGTARRRREEREEREEKEEREEREQHSTWQDHRAADGRGGLRWWRLSDTGLHAVVARRRLCCYRGLGCCLTLDLSVAVPLKNSTRTAGLTSPPALWQHETAKWAAWADETCCCC